MTFRWKRGRLRWDVPLSIWMLVSIRCILLATVCRIRRSKYDNVKLSSANLKKEDVLTVTFDLENTGKYEGTEVAQLYVQDKFASVTRPVKELKRFARVTLKPGEKKNVSFELPISELAFWNIDMVKTVEAGDFALWVAPDSQSGEEVFL